MAGLQSLTINDTGYLEPANGSRTQRPSPSTGMLRWNASINQHEIYNGSDWTVGSGRGGSTVIQENLIMYIDTSGYRPDTAGNTTVVDPISGYNATLQANTQVVDGVFRFDGIGERDGSPTGSYLSLNTTAMTTYPTDKPNGVTYQWWMKFAGEQPYGHSILFGIGTINHFEIRGSLASAYVRTEARRQNGKTFGNGTFPGGFEAGRWYNIAMSFDNAGGSTTSSTRSCSWYKDGELFQTRLINDGTYGDEYFIPNAFGRATGSSAYLYANSFYGDMAQFLVYDRNLSATEIKRNMNATRPRFLK